MTEEQLKDLSRYQESAAFSPVEKLVLDLAVAMTRTPVVVGDGLFAGLRKHFTNAQLVELATEISQANFRARFNRMFQCQPAGLSDGAFCPMPEQ